MPAIMVRCSKNLHSSINCITKSNSHGMNTKSSLLFILRNRSIITYSQSNCQAHVINLGTQVLIGTYSKNVSRCVHYFSRIIYSIDLLLGTVICQTEGTVK